ncbi:hypothetical protein [Sphingomonas elodea]|uniref:hypothetical protein n=1 Tax=Sphingomonas elodea TaxID=179878 RepID=UPI0003007B7A|nr:hypothetical protein [Sphingomonas elodea]
MLHRQDYVAIDAPAGAAGQCCMALVPARYSWRRVRLARSDRPSIVATAMAVAFALADRK